MLAFPAICNPSFSQYESFSWPESFSMMMTAYEMIKPFSCVGREIIVVFYSGKAISLYRSSGKAISLYQSSGKAIALPLLDVASTLFSVPSFSK
jgi:hypothetical protein